MSAAEPRALRVRHAAAPLLVGLFLLACAAREEEPDDGPLPAYVSDSSCAACHAYEAERWRGSHHDLAMQVATPATVLGDFDDAEHEHFGERTRFFRRGERFFVNTRGADGLPRDFEVAYTFGVAPLQQYLIELEAGRVQCLTTAWDTERGEWFHLYPDEPIEPGDPLHWTGRYQRWNAMCAACHSTHLERNYDPDTDGYATRWAEIDVGCQACHGPGADHVAWAEAHPEEDGDGLTPRRMGLVAPLRRQEQAAQIDACAPCHSRRSPLLDVDRPGAPFLDRFLPEKLHAGLYHPDGQILDEVYVYGSFAQSKMHQRGVACTDCHDPHSAEPVAAEPALCTQCHSESPPTDRFPTLAAKRYDTPEHHHHDPEGPGARCVACHMGERTYMVVDPRRDHSFRIPRPDLSALLGTPNACNQCHTEEDAEWAADHVTIWTDGRERPRHFAPIFAAAQAGVREAEGALGAVAADPETAPIVRATALELLRNYGTRGVPAMMAAVEDDDPLVRAAAVGGLDSLPEDARAKLAARFLSDPLRAVRVEAARVLADVPRASLSEAERAAMDHAFTEFLAVQDAQADLPGPHLNLGVVRAARGETGSAEAAYRRALRLDPAFLPAAFNLANLLNAQGRNDEAERVLRAAIEAVPGEGELYFSLGLLLAEMERMDEASDALEQAARRLPHRPRVLYNLGLLLQRAGRLAEAESALVRAVDGLPEDAEALHALVLLYAETEQWKRALPHAERLVGLAPANPNARELLERVRAHN